MTITNKPWDGSASKYKDTDAYCAACLIDDNPEGQKKVQDLCHLPVKEPGGAVNKNAVHNAAARIGQTQTSSANKKKAARALIGYYGQMKETPPDSLKNMAQ